MRSGCGGAERFRRPACKPPLIFGHRGTSTKGPENTLASFTRALDEGADGVELDTRLCASGELVVAHDVDLARLAGRPEAVLQMPWSELRDVDLQGGGRIPLLDDALDLVIGRGRLVNVEVKANAQPRAALMRAVVRTLARRRADERERVLLSTFDPRVALALGAYVRDIPCALLFAKTTWHTRAFLRVSRTAPVHPHHSLVTASSVSRWKRDGRIVNVWTVDDPALADRLAHLGVDALVTNSPSQAQGHNSLY